MSLSLKDNWVLESNNVNTTTQSLYLSEQDEMDFLYIKSLQSGKASGIGFIFKVLRPAIGTHYIRLAYGMYCNSGHYTEVALKIDATKFYGFHYAESGVVNHNDSTGYTYVVGEEYAVAFLFTEQGSYSPTYIGLEMLVYRLSDNSIAYSWADPIAKTSLHYENSYAETHLYTNDAGSMIVLFSPLIWNQSTLISTLTGRALFSAKYGSKIEATDWNIPYNGTYYKLLYATNVYTFNFTNEWFLLVNEFVDSLDIDVGATYATHSPDANVWKDELAAYLSAIHDKVDNFVTLGAIEYTGDWLLDVLIWLWNNAIGPGLELSSDIIIDAILGIILVASDFVYAGQQAGKQVMFDYIIPFTIWAVKTQISAYYTVTGVNWQLGDKVGAMAIDFVKTNVLGMIEEGMQVVT